MAGLYRYPFAATSGGGLAVGAAACPKFASRSWTLISEEAVSLRRFARLDLVQRGAGCCQPQIVVRLKIHPELRRHTKVLAQTQGDISADSPPPAHDLVDAGKEQRLGQLIRGDPHRLHEFGAQYLAGVGCN